MRHSRARIFEPQRSPARRPGAPHRRRFEL